MTLHRVESVLSKLHAVAVAISGIALFSLVFMITLDVFLRYVFNSPLPASVEVSQLLEPYVVFLPMAFAMAAHSHVRVTLFTGRFRGRLKTAAEIFAYVVSAVFFGLFFYWGWLHFWASFKINEFMLASVKLYWWIGKLAMPLGLILIAAECLHQILRTLAPAAAEERGRD
jgi:TRAP-type C4-dicarboxylate transport system permease small subunit